MAGRLERGFSPESGERSLGNFIVYKDDWQKIKTGLPSEYDEGLFELIKSLLNNTSPGYVVTQDLVAIHIDLIRSLLTAELRKVEFYYNTDSNEVIRGEKPAFSFSIGYNTDNNSPISPEARLHILRNSVVSADGSSHSEIALNRNQSRPIIGLMTEKFSMMGERNVDLTVREFNTKLFVLDKLVPIGQ